MCTRENLNEIIDDKQPSHLSSLLDMCIYEHTISNNYDIKTIIQFITDIFCSSIDTLLDILRDHSYYNFGYEYSLLVSLDVFYPYISDFKDVTSMNFMDRKIEIVNEDIDRLPSMLVMIKWNSLYERWQIDLSEEDVLYEDVIDDIKDSDVKKMLITALLDGGEQAIFDRSLKPIYKVYYDQDNVSIISPIFD